MVVACRFESVPELWFHRGDVPFAEFPVDNHCSLDETVVFLLGALSFVSTFELLIVVASPQCKDESRAVDVRSLLRLTIRWEHHNLCLWLREQLNNRCTARSNVMAYDAAMRLDQLHDYVEARLTASIAVIAHPPCSPHDRLVPLNR